MLSEGDRAPDFTLTDQHGESVSLSELLSAAPSALVLYFYPRADTPGCTTQASGVRDRTAEYERAGARVVGVSPDPVNAVRKFAEGHGLDFTLLADPDHAVAEAFGTWGERTMYGKTYMGVQRSTFLIDPGGRIVRVFPKVSPESHDEVVLDALGELAGR